MKNIIYKIIIFCSLVMGTVCTQAQESSRVFQTPFSKQLEKQMQQVPSVQQRPDTGRLGFMRFYFPNNEVKEEPGFLDKLQGCGTKTLIRAYAIYLYNMYVSTAAYREDMPTLLTVDYLGALDGFCQCSTGFNVKKSAAFYYKHQADIQRLLAEFFAKRGLTSYQPQEAANQAREEAFLKVLENTLTFGGKYPAYQLEKTDRLSDVLLPQDTKLLEQFLKRSLAAGKDKYVLFEQREMFGSELDSPLANGKAKTKVLFRPANEECAACSYLFGREMCEEIAAKHRNWGFMRLYQVTARPTEQLLKTSSGDTRFLLADGRLAEPWQYHTATLVVMNLNGRYTVYVVDPLLGGESPLSSKSWFSKFASKQTVFLIEPYQRKEATEQKFYVQKKVASYQPAF